VVSRRHKVTVYTITVFLQLTWDASFQVGRTRKSQQPSCVVVSYRRGRDEDDEHVEIRSNQNDVSEVDENTLTPSDLLAFAWQIAQGMVSDTLTYRNRC
jgi:hypothetical protein